MHKTQQAQHTSHHLDDGSGSLAGIGKAIPNGRRSIPASSKRSNNVQVPALSKRDHTSTAARNTARNGESKRGRAAYAACRSSLLRGHVVASSRSMPQRRLKERHKRAAAAHESELLRASPLYADDEDHWERGSETRKGSSCCRFRQMKIGRSTA